MPIKEEALQDELYNFLKTHGLKPIRLTSGGKQVALSKLADVFKFSFIMDDTNYGLVYAAIIGKDVVLWAGDDVYGSPNHSKGDDLSFNKISNYIKNWAHDHQLGFERDDIENLEDEMAKREETRSLNEGYHPLGKKASYNDSVPNVKIKIQHSQSMEEGMQRFRNVERIYLENVDGERFLLNTKRPGIARVYARHIAEGGKVNDDRWNHINGLVEEYTNMAGFVRATRNGQFNESTQVLVSEGTNHYLSLRETLHKLSGKKGYSKYFESWSPTLNEDMGIGQPDLAEMFMSSSIDPRIERAMPILARLHKVSGKIDEVNELEEWTNSIISEKLKPHTNIDIKELASQFAEEIPVGDDAINAINLLSRYNLENTKLFKELNDLANQDVDADARETILSWCQRSNDHNLHDLSNEIKTVMGGQSVAPAPEPIQQPMMEEGSDEFDENTILQILTLAAEGKRDPEIAKALGLKLSLVQEVLDIHIEDLESMIDQNIDEGIDSDQSKVKQLGPTEKAKSISPVIGKEPKQHPFKGKLVGASESIDPLIKIKKLSGLDKE
jgi:hypothetical protein